MTRNPQNKRKSGSEDADRDKMETRLDAEEENIRKFMETWSQIKFDSKKNSFTGKNEKGYTADIDIDAVQNFDEGGMIKIAYLESLKTKKKDQWVELPSEYKSYINEFAKGVLTYEDQINKQWAKIQYDAVNKCFLGSQRVTRRIDDNGERFEQVELASLIVKDLSKKLDTFRVAVNRARECENTWQTIAPGASNNTSNSSKSGYKVMSYNNSSVFKYFFQGRKNTCVFSSLASALSYKGFHEASEILHDNIETSLQEDPMIFACDLLKKVLTVTVFKHKNVTGRRIILDNTHNNPTLIQIVCEERNIVSKKRKSHDWINCDHAITICDDKIFDSNFDEPMELTLKNLNKCCRNITKPSCTFRAVYRGFVFSEKEIRSRVSRGRAVKRNSRYRSVESTRQIYKDKQDISFQSIIDNLHISVKELSLRILSNSFKRCADFYPEKDSYLDASVKLSSIELSGKTEHIFDLKESFIPRKPYCIQIKKKHYRYRDIRFGYFEIPTLMLISITNIFNNEIYDIIVLLKGEIFTSCFESGVQRDEKRILEYMESKNCDDFQKIRVLRTFCFYGRSLRGSGKQDKTLSRGSYHRSPSSGNLSMIFQIDDLWDAVCTYIGDNGVHETFNASEEISMFIRRKRGIVRVEKDYNKTRKNEAKRTETICDNWAKFGNKEKEKVEWDKLRRLLHELFKSYQKEMKETQELISSSWSQIKYKVCLALYIEGLPTTAEGILSLHERYLNNFTR